MSKLFRFQVKKRVRRKDPKCQKQTLITNKDNCCFAAQSHVDLLIHNQGDQIRVARWYIFIPKIPLKMENVCIFYGHFEYFTVIWYILGPFGNDVVIWHIFHLFSIGIVSIKIWQLLTKCVCKKVAQTPLSCKK
jgi:hypothetical protein